MNTYTIQVERKTSKEYEVKASSLEEAKRKAIRLAEKDPSHRNGPDLITSALCRKITGY